MLHDCRKQSRAAATKADEASLKLQRAQGENEVALQAGRDLDKQDAALKVSITQKPYRLSRWIGVDLLPAGFSFVQECCF